MITQDYIPYDYLMTKNKEQREDGGEKQTQGISRNNNISEDSITIDRFMRGDIIVTKLNKLYTMLHNLNDNCELNFRKLMSEVSSTNNLLVRRSDQIKLNINVQSRSQ